nr:diguanylate cyclase [Micromonospora sp. DSM 115978]
QRDGEPYAVFVLGTRADSSLSQLGYESLGSLGLGDEGGLSSLDVFGRARYSWDPELIGQRLADPAVLASLPPSGVVRLPESATTAPDSVAFAARDPALVDGGYVLFELPTSEALSGLRPSQLGRDLLLLTAVALTVFGLASASRFLERATRRQTEQLSAMLHNVHDIVVVVGRDGHVTFASSAVTRLLGYDVKTAIERPWALVHPDDVDRVLRQLAWPGTAGGSQRPDVASTVSDGRRRGADGVYRWFDLHISDQVSHPHIGGMLLTVHDVTERKRMQDQLVWQARYDPLTSLPNRSALSNALRPDDGEPGRATAPAALVFVDLDHFKQVNDTLGHEAGDSVLRTVARRLDHACRPGDVVYRVGGDEFVVVLDVASRDEAVAVAERLLNAVATAVEYDGRVVDLSATVGV